MENTEAKTTVIQRKLTVQQYMLENGIKSKTTVYQQIKNKIIEAVDLSNGKAKKPTLRIIVREELPTAA